MALLVDKKYLKITGIYINYIDNSTLITTKYYKDEENRLREKELLPLVLKFKENALKYINDIGNKLYDEIYNIVNDDSKIIDYALNNSKYKEILDLNDNLITEYHSKLFNLLNVDIDKNDLKYLDLWYSLGLSDSMFSKIELLNTDEESYVLDYILTDTNLENVYKELKKLLPNSINC